MTRLRVWVPNATRSVEVVGSEPAGGDVAKGKGPKNERRIPLSPAEDGWFEGDHPFAEYALSIDGGEPRPDPRSPWQPHGVHGPSRVIDHGTYRWRDGAWRGRPLETAVIYELHVGTFSSAGTFDGVVERLDHLVRLGVDAIELMPVNEFPGTRGWGYDGVALYAPHHAYGGPEGLKRLVDACHQQGLAVVLDVVYNHLGPSGNYLRDFGPYFTDRYGTPWGDALNFDDAGADEVRAFFIDNAAMWLCDYHLDGLRLDAVHAIFDRSAIHFLEELGDRVRALENELGRTLWVIAESDLNDPRLVWDKKRGGYGLDAQWSDDFHHALHACLTGERAGYYADFGRVEDIATALRHAFVYDGRHSLFRRRRHGRPTDGVPAHRFLGYLQDHDQVGNRALGERTSALLSPGLLKVGAALILTSPFVPMLFMGEEWAASTPFLYFTDHDDPKLGRAVTEGRKREFSSFGWDPEEIPDPQSPATFDASRLRWDELDDPHHADMLDWHRTLIELRRTHPALSDERMDLVETTHNEDPPWLVVRRGDPGAHVWIACNFSNAEVDATLPDGHVPQHLVMTSSKKPERSGDTLLIPARTVAIYAE